MHTEQWIAGKGSKRTMALQEKEFILGGQLSEDGTTRLEVALVASGGKTTLELRLSGWGEGIGWYIQRRIQLDPLQIGALKAILGKGVSRINSSVLKLKMTRKIEEYTITSFQRSSASVCS